MKRRLGPTPPYPLSPKSSNDWKWRRRVPRVGNFQWLEKRGSRLEHSRDWKEDFQRLEKPGEQAELASLARNHLRYFHLPRRQPRGGRSVARQLKKPERTEPRFPGGGRGADSEPARWTRQGRAGGGCGGCRRKPKPRDHGRPARPPQHSTKEPGGRGRGWRVFWLRRKRDRYGARG
ncbi:hypothetical protein PDESU_06175 [Pontiella desulfatans]|uniref:Uncharacterized protein n=1 Tax=Pontiella desulfatans TaxID=2750659 RepID=A0A6C2UDE6_PONDE|nr:hypothetical protein PDESU_06175 [Pontiella desulfatans]